FLQHFLPGQALEENGHKSAGIQSAWYFFGNLDWVVGFDGEATDAFLKETQPSATEGSPFLVETIYQGTHYDYEVKAYTLAAFVQASMDVGDNVQIVTGVRAERVDYDYDNLMLAGRTRDDGTPCGFGGCRFNRPADRDDNFTNLSPKLGLIYNLDQHNQLYARIARGYRAPQATELYRLQAGQNVSRIDSEQLDSLEAGIRGKRGALGYEFSVWTMKKDNFIFRDSNRTNVDNGETSHVGAEITLSYAFSDTLTGALYWSRARHEYDNNPDLASSDIEGNLIDTAPEEFGSANLRWRPSSKLLAELEWIHMGAYWEDPENLHKYDGHDLLNLRVSYHVNRNLETFVRILNLPDERYAERADFSFGEDRYFVGEPASLYLGFNLQI
ncbi:MAG: TonB-dependent receptor, partial [Pseudomonadales bacterium]|nr:TonB-dependent receptor [Pseudomonadales bacterium]